MSPKVAEVPAATGAARSLYLELLKQCLTRLTFAERYRPIEPSERWGRLRRRVYENVDRLLAARHLHLVRDAAFDRSTRLEGRDWPADAETMIGMERLDNVQACVLDVLQAGVPGDLIEAGVWRGGVTILMRALLKVTECQDRHVWVADSFEGLPRPDADRYPADRDDRHWTFEGLRIPIEEVRANFSRYGLLDDQVRFLKGWFSETLVSAPIERLAVLRIDADMYQSTREALQHLYPKLSVGGYAIVDDYGAVPACRAAVDNFRSEQGITDELVPIDWTGVYWQRRHAPDER